MTNVFQWIGNCSVVTVKYLVYRYDIIVISDSAHIITQVVRLYSRLPVLPSLSVPETAGVCRLVEVFPLPHQLGPGVGSPPLHHRGRPCHEEMEEGNQQTKTSCDLPSVQLCKQRANSASLAPSALGYREHQQ